VAVDESILVRRSTERFTTSRPGIVTRHLLSFGDHYDPGLTSFGALVAHNDEVLQPGSGYAAHRHRGLEIVTWVVEGTLIHEDEVSGETVLNRRSVQTLDSATGVTHAEHAVTDATGPTRFVQMWLTVDEGDAGPRYASATIDPGDLRAGLAIVASGRPDDAGSGALPLRQRQAACHVGWLAAADRRALPGAALLHVFVVVGSVSLGGDVVLDAGDSALISNTRGVVCTALVDAEIVVWALGSAGRPD
jgi:redox-sensitive bicupin YhaK (pirin superfamily)